MKTNSTRSWKAKLGLLMLGLGAALHAHSQSGTPDHQDAPKLVYVAEIHDTIDPGSANFLKTSIQKAEADKAQALLVELDTPGGLVTSVKEMAQAIDQSQVPVVVYVTPAGASATSAGALLTLASHVAAMAPGSHIGAAHPVDSSGQDIPGAMGEKAVSDTAAFAQGLAEVRGRNRDLAEAMVAKSKSFTAPEALQNDLIDVVANTRAELLRKIDGRAIDLRKGLTMVIRSQGAQVQVLQMSWGQKLLHTIAHPNIAALLMTLGLLCLYFEISTPGLTIPGVVGAIMILVAFMSFQLLPIRTGGLLLLILGAVMLIAEPFVPTHGALAIGGTISFILGLIWVIDPAASDLTVSAMIWVPAAIALGGSALLIAWAAARSQLLLKRTRQKIGGEGPAGLSGYRGLVEWVHIDGLRGKALIRGEVWDFESNEPVGKGEHVEVLSVEGMHVKVKRSG